MFIKFISSKKWLVNNVIFLLLLVTLISGCSGGIYAGQYEVSSNISSSKFLLKTLQLYPIPKFPGRVQSVTISPNGQMLAAAGSYYQPDIFWNTIKIWNLMTGKQIHNLKGHLKTIRSLAFSPDGRIIASASDDNTIKLWNPKTGELLRVIVPKQLRTSNDYISTAIFSPDGQIIASDGNREGIKLWNPKTGKLLRTLKDLSKYRNLSSDSPIAFSPSGEILASGSSNNTIMLWDLETGRLLDTLGKPLDSHWINCLTFSRDGNILISGQGYGNEGGQIKLWDLKNRKILKIFRQPSGVDSIAISPNGHIIASAGNFMREIRLWSLETGELFPLLDSHSNGITYGDAGTVPMSIGVHSVIFSPDGQLLISGNNDNTIRIWQVPNR